MTESDYSPVSPRVRGASTPRAKLDNTTRAVARPASPGSRSRRFAGPRDETTPTLTESHDVFAASRTQAGDALRVGAQLGRYVILSKLGEGGMGQVYSAFDRELERRVAIKVLRENLAGDSKGWARMRREAQALARVSHPYVVQVYDVGEFDGRLFLAMEFVKGETLRAWQRRHSPETPAGRRAIVDMYIQAGRGLAAAHAEGLVHRDFKPENVLVGEDGRPRVLDFGLAVERRAASASTREGEYAGGSLLDSDLTRTGSIMGTPSYMAPEQFLAMETDQRADIFAFSASLFEALYGVRPFRGDSFVELRAAVLTGEPRPRPGRSSVPVWLDTIIRDGLARDLDARPASLAATLDALSNDPIASRRRRRRLVASVCAIVLAIAGVVLGGVSLRQRWQHRHAQAQAATRLEAVERRIEALRATGAVEEAERAFSAFVSNPDNRGTFAHGRAWLHRAARSRARGDGEEAIDSFAAAYVSATELEDHAAALVGLVEMFRETVRWPELARALATLAERHEDVSQRPEIAALRLDSALARRDFASARALLRGPLADRPQRAALPVVEALATAVTTSLAHCVTKGAPADLDGDGDRELNLKCDRLALDDAPPLPSALRSALNLIEREPFAVNHVDGEPALQLMTEPPAVGADVSSRAEAVLRQRVDGGSVELFRWPEDPITALLAADLDGDGDRNILVGTGPYTRHVVELARDPTGAWSRRSPAPELDRRASDINSLLADDLDGDGTIELIAVLGPWQAYEIQVLRHDPASDTLRTITRRRLGYMSGAALARRRVDDRERVELVVSRSDRYDNAAMFPPDRPRGDPPGTYRFRLVDDELVETAFVPAPSLGPGADSIERRPIAADLDGDGQDEVIVSRRVREHPDTEHRHMVMIQVNGPDGSLIPIYLSEMWGLSALDVDGDGDDELIVSVGDDWAMWALGVGERATPSVTSSRSTPGADEPDVRDPVLARMWRRAADLAHIGLLRQAGDSFVTISDSVDQGDLRRVAQMNAGALYEALSLDARAARLFHEATMTSPATARGVEHIAAARAYLRLGDFPRAAEHLVDAPTVGETKPALERALSGLRGAPGVELTFDEPLDRRWRIAQPVAVARDGVRGSLHVDAITPGELLSAPVVLSGGTSSLEVELTVDRIEWSSALAIAVIPEAGGVTPLAANARSGGGGTAQHTDLECLAHNRVRLARLTSGEDGDVHNRIGRFSIRVMSIPALNEMTCEITRADGTLLRYARVRLRGAHAPSGRYRLAISSMGGGTSWVSADIHRISMYGARLASLADAAREDSSVNEAARRLSEDDLLGALQVSVDVVGPSRASELIEMSALARLGRWPEAQAVLERILTREGHGADSLDVLLRIEPEVYGALLRGATSPAAAREAIVEAWAPLLDAGTSRDARTSSVLWAALAEVELANDSFELLELRARVAYARGQLDVAARTYRAALIALEDPSRRGPLAPGSRERARSRILFELASLAIKAGDEDGARALLAELFDGDNPDVFYVDALRARADLRPLWGMVPEPFGGA